MTDVWVRIIFKSRNVHIHRNWLSRWRMCCWHPPRKSASRCILDLVQGSFPDGLSFIILEPHFFQSKRSSPCNDNHFSHPPPYFLSQPPHEKPIMGCQNLVLLATEDESYCSPNSYLHLWENIFGVFRPGDRATNLSRGNCSQFPEAIKLDSHKILFHELLQTFQDS